LYYPIFVIVKGLKMSSEPTDIVERKQELADFFSRSAPTYGHVGPRFFTRFGLRLVECARIPIGSQVLDVAAGRGAVLFPAAEAVGSHGRVVGIDLSTSMVEQTSREIEQRALSNVSMQQMDAEHLQFPDESFDFILCGFAVFFFPQLDRALSEFRRVLRPQGCLGISTWGQPDDRWKWYNDLFETYLPSPPEEQAPDSSPAPRPVFNKPEGVAALLGRAGFADTQVVSDEADFIYGSVEEWWQTQWSHGARGGLEEIERKGGAELLERFKTDAFEKLQTIKQPDGIHELFRALFAVATKPVK
jgi:ubiquinone/menaquinone biosynthesis C-methylase UbiE